MGLEKPPPQLSVNDVFDGAALRAALGGLAQSTGDLFTLRKEGLSLIKAAFLQGREAVKRAVTDQGLHGLAAAQTLSGLQDAVIQVIYDFATQHVYLAQNPTNSERITVVATGGYGRGELAPGSDVDLLFIRP